MCPTIFFNPSQIYANCILFWYLWLVRQILSHVLHCFGCLLLCFLSSIHYYYYQKNPYQNTIAVERVGIIENHWLHLAGSWSFLEVHRCLTHMASILWLVCMQITSSWFYNWFIEQFVFFLTIFCYLFPTEQYWCSYLKSLVIEVR